MKISRQIRINKPAAAVWKILAHDFDKADQWMSLVPKSHAINEGTPTDNAPMTGRVCEFSPKSNGPRADERIIAYNEELRQMTVRVVPIDTKFPIVHNDLSLSVNALNSEQSEVHWNANFTLTPKGYLLYPLLKMGIGKSFAEVLDDLKYFAEKGKPHPRNTTSF